MIIRARACHRFVIILASFLKVMTRLAKNIKNDESMTKR